MPGILTLGEMLVEVMRKVRDVPFNVPGEFIGPYPSGAPAIFADAVAKLCFPSAIIGVVGDDEFGMLILDRLKGDGVDVSHVRVLRNYLTGIAFISYFSSGSRRFIFHLKHSASSKLSPKHVDENYISQFEHLHIMGSTLSIGRSVREACYKAAEIAYSNGASISLDPNVRLELISPQKFREVCRPIISKASIILPNVEEIKVLTGIKNIDLACRSMLNGRVKVIAVKMGSSGSIVYYGGEREHIPAFKVEEVDPTGAGDTYDAAFIVGFLKGWSPEKAGYYANAAGALAVTKFGPMEGCPTNSEILEFIGREKPEILKMFKT
jgi:sugar/nucleoside kinase (ribokinase family)